MKTTYGETIQQSKKFSVVLINIAGDVPKKVKYFTENQGTVEIPDKHVLVVANYDDSDRNYKITEIYGDKLLLRRSLPTRGIWWVIKRSGREIEPVDIHSFQDFVLAIANKVKVRNFHSKKWVSMPYVRVNVRTASCMWRMEHGILRKVTGVNDDSPFLDKNGEITSASEIKHKAEIEALKAAEAIREEMDWKGKMSEYLEWCYERSYNPLPELRSKYPGSWRYSEIVSTLNEWLTWTSKSGKHSVGFTPSVLLK